MTDRDAINQLAKSFDIGGDLTDLTYVRPGAVTRAVTVLNEQHMEPIKAFHAKWSFKG
jgi:hypothetical protein